MGFVNDETQKRLEEIIPQCVNCSYTNLQIRSIVMVFDELASIGEIELLHKVQGIHAETHIYHMKPYDDVTG